MWFQLLRIFITKQNDVYERILDLKIDRPKCSPDYHFTETFFNWNCLKLSVLAEPQFSHLYRWVMMTVMPIASGHLWETGERATFVNCKGSILEELWTSIPAKLFSELPHYQDLPCVAVSSLRWPASTPVLIYFVVAALSSSAHCPEGPAHPLSPWLAASWFFYYFFLMIHLQQASWISPVGTW